MPISYTTAWLYIAWKPCIIFFVYPNYQTKCQTRLGAIMHLEYSISYHRVINILYNGIIMRNDAEKLIHVDPKFPMICNIILSWKKLKSFFLTVGSNTIFSFYVLTSMQSLLFVNHRLISLVKLYLGSRNKVFYQQLYFDI